MSRTIKFEIRSTGKDFTVRQLRRMYNISEFYSRNFKWTLDPFWVGPNEFEPNMEKFQDEQLAQETLKSFMDEYLKGDYHHIDALIEGEKRGLCKSIIKLNSPVYFGSVRVLGNEANARTVLKALSELSIVFPEAVILVQDEGHLLYSDLIIQKGCALPDTSWVPNLMKDLIEISSSAKSGHIAPDSMVMLKYYESDKRVRMNSLKYIVRKLSQKLERNSMKFSDLRELDHKDWPDVEFFLRNVNLGQFADYKAKPHTLLGGYYGEHWNLVDVDVEAESYRFLSNIQKTMANDGPNGSIEVF